MDGSSEVHGPQKGPRLTHEHQKESRRFTTCDLLALEIPLGGSQPIMHTQKSPWALDVGHVNNLKEGKLLF